MASKSNIRYSVYMPKTNLWWYPALKIWAEGGEYKLEYGNFRNFRTLAAAKRHATHLANTYGKCEMARYIWQNGKRKITVWEITNEL